MRHTGKYILNHSLIMVHIRLRLDRRRWHVLRLTHWHMLLGLLTHRWLVHSLHWWTLIHSFHLLLRHLLLLLLTIIGPLVVLLFRLHTSIALILLIFWIRTIAIVSLLAMTWRRLVLVLLGFVIYNNVLIRYLLNGIPLFLCYYCYYWGYWPGGTWG